MMHSSSTGEHDFATALENAQQIEQKKKDINRQLSDMTGMLTLTVVLYIKLLI